MFSGHGACLLEKEKGVEVMVLVQITLWGEYGVYESNEGDRQMATIMETITSEGRVEEDKGLWGRGVRGGMEEGRREEGEERQNEGSSSQVSVGMLRLPNYEKRGEKGCTERETE
ncbi:hypothetical protein CBR_g37931 [Chara braunii]|uniref:Uncharacterized protein n=1 Tax=Chara braunii TaxID=69332 RepID=A0A388LNX9_CHABU|nr:hypothetical protein CBR_g37931 [Chara braunii]|eukprot:GBG84056.1 hypothetical protein CBR_g37931 [Chara braunii]